MEQLQLSIDTSSFEINYEKFDIWLDEIDSWWIQEQRDDERHLIETVKKMIAEDKWDII